MRRLLLAATLSLLAACAASVDKSPVRAQEGPTQSTTVDVVTIPYDPQLPRWIVTVEPMRVGSSQGTPGAPAPSAQDGRGNRGWGPWGFGSLGTADPAPPEDTGALEGLPDRVGSGIQAQLISALSNAGNVVVIDYDHYLKHQDDPAKLRRPGELGPYVIEGTVTDFTEVAEAEGSKKGASLGWAGAVAGVAGAVAGSPTAGIAGAAVAAADPKWEQTKMRRTGAVAMDLQIVEPDSGRIIGTVSPAGRFTSESATGGLSVFDVGGGETAFAQSSIGQVTRAAMNDAVQKVVTRLTVAAR
jgi:curli biogenesis system outer membrane secretion channel CsgG